MRTPFLHLTCPLAAGVVAIVAALSPAVAADLSKLPPPASQAGLTYAKDIRPLFEASCFNCHGERRQRAGLRLDSLEGALQGSDEIKVVIPGNSKDSPLVQAVAQIDEETAMPPRRQRGGMGGFGGAAGSGQGGPAGPGGPGVAGGAGGTARGPGRAGATGGRGGPGRGEGGGFGDFLAAPLFSQADRDGDKKVSSTEFSQLADAWFDQLDTEKVGKLTEEQFTGRLDSVLASAPTSASTGRPVGGGRGAGGQRGGNEGMGFSPSRMIGAGIFGVADADKDSRLTREELKATFTKWSGEWDTEKTGALTESMFRNGLTASVMRGGSGGRGPGGAFGGMGPFGRQALAQQMVTQGDADKNGKVSKAEFVGLADTWFTKLDAKKSGQVNQEIFAEKLAEALGLPQPEADQTPTNRPGIGATNNSRDARSARAGESGAAGDLRGLGGPASLAPGLFAAIDSDKNGFVTLAELKATFTRWSGEYDAEKTGSLDADQLYAGLRVTLPQGTMGAFGGFGGRDQGPAPKPLSAEQVGLVRAWIDQGAK